MKEFDIFNFHSYLEENYYNPNKSCIPISHYPFPECVYAFGDLWFYTVGDVFYVLRILGFQLGYNGRYLYFIKVNEKICPAVTVGDEITDVHFEDSKRHIRMSFINSTGTKLSTFINVPVFSAVQPMIECKSIGCQTAYIKLNSFSNFDVDSISAAIKDSKYLFVDLRDNMGGSVNDMIKVLSLFSICDNCFKVRDSDGYVHAINITRSKLDLAKLEAINFQVNELTASSAEMFTISLRAMYPGRIYGERTTGKMVIQDFVRVSDSIVAVPIYRFVLPIFYGNNLVKIDAYNRIIPDVRECPLSIASTFSDF